MEDAEKPIPIIGSISEGMDGDAPRQRNDQGDRHQRRQQQHDRPRGSGGVEAGKQSVKRNP
ncbi:MAG: hypothetical protein ACREV7_06380 [Steroidobacteraceae bacterium]